MKNAAIFRQQLFKPSEIFIKSQISHYKQYKPVLVGRSLFGQPEQFSFIAPIKNADNNARFYWETLIYLLFRAPSLFLPKCLEAKFAIVHAHFAVDGVMAVPLVKKLAVPFVTTLHGMDVTRSNINMLFSGSPSLINFVLFKRQLFKRCDLFLCVSQFIKQAAIKAGFPESKLQVHYIGIDTQQLTDRCNAGEDGLIVHVGRLVEKKGTSYLLQAFAKIYRSIDNPRLVIIGDGPLKPALMDEAKSLGIQELVFFLGVQPNSVVLDWVRRAAVMAVPSVTAKDGDMEGFGIVNIEASAQGVPVVGFNSGGIPEAIINNVTGFLSEEKDVDGLAENLKRLLLDKSLRINIGCAGRKNVEENFDISKQTAKLEQIYSELLKSYE
ncbi:glycosyltransferase [Methylophilus glucosoxydans]|uniref:Glycosyltransferase n=1 Tax=Methylophilus glucosoxydans TaxID=752553 RepID=A0ABW3GJQ8_9PROT